MAGNRKLIIEVVADADKLQRGLKKAEGSLQGFNRRASSRLPGGAGGIVGGVGKAGVIGAGVAAGATVAAAAISKVIAKAKEAQIAQVQLDQAFATSGVSAAKFGKTAEASIQRVSKSAAIDDEEVSGVFANLLRSTGSLEKAQKGVALAANIARARNISLSAAGKAVEKAYNGSDAALKRVGVTVPKVSVRYDALKEKIKKLTDEMHTAKGPQKDALGAQIDAAKAGLERAKQLDKEASAQDAIAKAQRQFAGAAERYGKTAAGAQEKYQVALENVEERIGAKLLPLQTKLALAAVRFLDWADANWPRFAKAISDAWQTAKPVVDNIVNRVKDIANVIAGVVQTINAIRNGNWSLAWKGLKKVAVAEIDFIYHAFIELPLKIAKGLGKAAFAGLERIFFNAVNRLIDIVNKAISAYNKIPLVPNIGKIGHIGVSTGTPGTTGPVGTRSTQAVVVPVYLDGRKISQSSGRYQTTTAARNPSQRRGPNAGLVVVY